MYISEKIDTKRKIESRLYEILCKYTYKYLNKIYHNQMVIHPKTINYNFQKELIKISKWSEDTINKEYFKFLKWCKKKYDYKEQHLQNLLREIVTLNTMIMINKTEEYTISLLETYDFPKLQVFFYKCLKKISRFFYENPKSINRVSFGTLKSYIESITTSMLPLKHITAVLEYNSDEDNNTQPEQLIIEYDFENLSFSSSNGSNGSNGSNKTNKSNGSNKNNIVVEKVNSDNEHDDSSIPNKVLHYLSSEDFEETPLGTPNKSQINLNQDENRNENEETYKSTDDNDNLKHIRVPKIKRNQ
jgi:hypothetical protein